MSNRSNSFLSDRFLCQDNAVLPVASVWGYGRTMQVRILVTCGGRKISFSWLLDLWSSCLLNRRSSWLFEERFSSPLSCPCPVPLTYRNCCFQTFRWVAGIFPSAAGTQYLPVASAEGRLFIPVSCLLAGILAGVLASFFPDALADFLLCFSLYPVQQLSVLLPKESSRENMVRRIG